MKDQFEIWTYDFKNKGGPHPVVLISHPERCAHSKIVNVLYCTSQRQNRQPYDNEVMLIGSDGRTWETLCDCSIMYAVPSAELSNRRGVVTPARRNAIRDKVRDLYLLADRD
jgi:mRNA-degrading endonuclease toxin of MazEF toxin-antitoxin module